MKNKALLSLSLLSLSLLQACGGGGGSSNSDSAAAPAPAPAQAATPALTNSGAVSAPFARAAEARFMLVGIGSQSFSRLTTSEQAASGAMVRLNDNVLSGESSTREISGDATYALGRWAAGTVTRTSGADTLTGKDNHAFHYVAYNTLSKLPTSGQATCDAGVFTAPTYVGGGSGVALATVGSTVAIPTRIVFAEDGATVTGGLQVTVDTDTAALGIDTKFTSPNNTAITDAFLSGGAGAAVQIGDAGGNAYVLAVSYVSSTRNGARYTGVAKLRCV